jgi:hypothetical protein
MLAELRAIRHSLIRPAGLRSSRHIDGRSVGNFDLHRQTVVKAQPDISLKCHDAVYPCFWSYNVLMSFPPPLSLHHYFVVAARMRHHFESNLVAVEEPRVAAPLDPDLAAFDLFSGPRGNFMYYWYASLYIVVQGFRKLKLIDPRINPLLASPNVKALRRCWNGVFHYQPDFFSATLLEPIQSPDFIGWVRELMEAFRAYFTREIKSFES